MTNRSQTPIQLAERYGKSDEGHFWVSNTISVPHPYCIGPAHVTYAADRWGGVLNDECIKAAERNKVTSCQICKGKLKYEEHETALLVTCSIELAEGKEELHQYLLECKPKCEEDGFAGFAFVKA